MNSKTAVWLVVSWVLATTLERGERPSLTIWPTEQACVAAGEAWQRDHPQGVGWICTPADEQPS